MNRVKMPNVALLIKETERYVFIYTDTRRDELLRTIGRFAADPDLGLTWGDAVILSQRIREAARV